MQAEIDKIIDLRKSAYRLNLPIIILLAIGIIMQINIPGSNAIFGLLIFVVFYRRIIMIAHYPCPQCKKPFGTSAAFPLGIGSDFCENCNLSLKDYGYNKENQRGSK